MSWARRGASRDGMAGGLLSGDAPVRGADGHADAREIPLAEDVAGHDLARGEYVARGPAGGHQHARAIVDRHAEVGEGDARPQRITVEGRRVDGARPVRLRRGEAGG